ncbi:MAG: ankyrin repeat domain-containing protein [Sphingobacteriia bacterium]|nr:ankyrin repeat domain-containing protein [Sphingobacteriia bacterium]
MRKKVNTKVKSNPHNNPQQSGPKLNNQFDSLISSKSGILPNDAEVSITINFTQITNLNINHLPQNNINYDENGYTNLHKAVKGNNFKAVQAILRNNPDINVRDLQYGKTALHIAAESGFREIVNLLLQYKEALSLDLDIKDREGYTALHLASMPILSLNVSYFEDYIIESSYPSKMTLLEKRIKDYDDIVFALIERGANFNILDNYNRSCLDFHIQNGKTEVIAQLLEIPDIIINDTTLYNLISLYAAKGEISYLKNVYCKDTCKNEKFSSIYIDYLINQKDILNLVKFLIDCHNHKIKIKNIHKILELAIVCNKQEIIVYFIKNNGFFNLALEEPLFNNMTLLDNAISSNHLMVIEELLKAQVNFNETQLKYIFNLAALNLNENLFSYMLNGFKIDINREGEPLLKHGISTSDSNLLMLLLKYGITLTHELANEIVNMAVYCKDSKLLSFMIINKENFKLNIHESGAESLEYAINNNQCEIAETLLKAGISANLTYIKYLLKLSIEECKTSLLSYLLSNKMVFNLDVNMPLDESESLPLHYAVKSGNIIAVNLLLEHEADCFSRDVEGKSPIDWAVLLKRDFIAKRMLEGKVEDIDDYIKQIADILENPMYEPQINDMGFLKEEINITTIHETNEIMKLYRVWRLSADKGFGKDRMDLMM